MHLKYSKENNIIFCPQHCISSREEIKLVDIIRERLARLLIDAKNFSSFHIEKSRSFHFPALECVGENPHIAILGITKGSTQVEHSLKSLASSIPAIEISSNQLADIINNTSVHSVFAGEQIRRNMSRIFNKIGLWEILKIEYNEESPENNINRLIGNNYDCPHPYFYIASFVKCAMLTTGGKSNAPSCKEILSINSALKCIENNLFPPFQYYNKLKTVITFGKTSFDLVYKVDVNGKPIIEHFKEMNILPIFLPHPSGANINNIQNYLRGKFNCEWVTSPCEANQILAKRLNGLNK